MIRLPVSPSRLGFGTTILVVLLALLVGSIHAQRRALALNQGHCVSFQPSPTARELGNAVVIQVPAVPENDNKPIVEARAGTPDMHMCIFQRQGNFFVRMGAQEIATNVRVPQGRFFTAGFQCDIRPTGMVMQFFCDQTILFETTVPNPVPVQVVNVGVDIKDGLVRLLSIFCGIHHDACHFYNQYVQSP
jgi:hypothetical protein